MVVWCRELFIINPFGLLTFKKKYQVYLEKYFGVIPVESQLAEADKLILKYIWNSRRPQITNLKKNKVECTHRNFKTYYKVTTIKAV